MIENTGGDVVDVLLVEDDAGDALIVREAFAYHQVRNTLHVVTDGEQALRFVRQAGEFAGVPRPGLIMLDLNLPRRSGMEVLAELKADSNLRVIPIVILTTSRSEDDVLRSYSLHANAYVTKPADFEQFMDAIREINNFFVAVVQLPGP
jgi:CheY-like chemotaxis protein